MIIQYRYVPINTEAIVAIKEIASFERLSNAYDVFPDYKPLFSYMLLV